MNSKKRKKIVLFWVMVVLTILVNFPIITMLLNSFRTTSEIMSSKSILPSKITFSNYIHLGSSTNFGAYFKNSLIVALSGTLISIIIAAFAGYAMSRYRSRFISGYSQSLLLLQMFPGILVLIPLFIMFRNVGLVNTYWSVILLYITGNLPFAIWMYKGFFDSIPKELEEASWIDGCSRLQSFLRITLPLSGPGIAAVGIFSFLFSWNEYLVASTFLRGDDLMTIPVGIQMFMQQFSTDWGSLTAAATLAMMPPFIFSLFVQKHMVHGAVAGSVKG
ncbi:carbohydrate ABC transporter permease [Neobacillus cucumis]|uniref:Carbohydrate ABC transporter permease n=1 Tax=Neobacillus cucumis TaxID=1740721 RepID=A0A2N5HVW5_9BACI|nr:carbohydrate ABC transporter permease [Neobacillus cucumis]PLS09659.1 carbohydrate ABC transporter permease [Neobacillus cucumis]